MTKLKFDEKTGLFTEESILKIEKEGDGFKGYSRRRMTNKEIREKLETQHWDRITFKQDSRDGMVHKGDVYVRKGYFYRHGMTPDALCDRVLKVFPEAKIIDSGDHWAPWPRESYMWVIFRLDRTKETK